MAMKMEEVRVRCLACAVTSMVKIEVQGQVLILPAMRCLKCCGTVKVLSPWLRKIIDAEVEMVKNEWWLSMTRVGDDDRPKIAGLDNLPTPNGS